MDLKHHQKETMKVKSDDDANRAGKIIDNTYGTRVKFF